MILDLEYFYPVIGSAKTDVLEDQLQQERFLTTMEIEPLAFN